MIHYLCCLMERAEYHLILVYFRFYFDFYFLFECKIIEHESARTILDSFVMEVMQRCVMDSSQQCNDGSTSLIVSYLYRLIFFSIRLHGTFYFIGIYRLHEMSLYSNKIIPSTSTSRITVLISCHLMGRQSDANVKLLHKQNDEHHNYEVDALVTCIII